MSARKEQEVYETRAYTSENGKNGLLILSREGEENSEENQKTPGKSVYTLPEKHHHPERRGEQSTKKGEKGGTSKKDTRVHNLNQGTSKMCREKNDAIPSPCSWSEKSFVLEDAGKRKRGKND